MLPGPVTNSALLARASAVHDTMDRNDSKSARYKIKSRKITRIIDWARVKYRNHATASSRAIHSSRPSTLIRRVRCCPANSSRPDQSLWGSRFHSGSSDQVFVTTVLFARTPAFLEGSLICQLPVFAASCSSLTATDDRNVSRSDSSSRSPAIDSITSSARRIACRPPFASPAAA